MLMEWPCPLPGGGTSNELLLTLKQDRAQCVLMIPPLFDEHNKFRRQIVEVMRRLDAAGIDCVLPDLPGCNESIRPLAEQTLANWRNAAQAAIQHTGASHMLTFRGGAMLGSGGLPGWKYAPQTGAKQLRGMIRAAVIAARELGKDISSDDLMARGRTNGLNLAGWDVGPQLFSELADSDEDPPSGLTEIAQSDVGGRGLWLRTEPDEDADQADALAQLIAKELAAP